MYKLSKGGADDLASTIILASNKEVFLVDGNRFFNRPGPSILESLYILCEIIHPDIFQPKPSNKRWIKL